MSVQEFASKLKKFLGLAENGPTYQADKLTWSEVIRTNLLGRDLLEMGDDTSQIFRGPLQVLRVYADYIYFDRRWTVISEDGGQSWKHHQPKPVEINMQHADVRGRVSEEIEIIRPGSVYKILTPGDNLEHP